MNPIERLIQYFGGQQETADAVGVSQATIANWKKGAHGVRAEHAIAAERASCGAVKAYELCPALKGYSAA